MVGGARWKGGWRGRGSMSFIAFSGAQKGRRRKCPIAFGLGVVKVVKRRLL